VLGITWAQIRGKIVTALGPKGETIMKGLEVAFDVVKALVQGGIAAVWELIKEKLSDLKDQVISGIVSFVTDTIVKKAIPKIIGMFIPGAGFHPGDHLDLRHRHGVRSEDLQDHPSGDGVHRRHRYHRPRQHRARRQKVESTLAGLLSLAISFLAGFLGLGKVTDKIMAVVQKVREKVDARHRRGDHLDRQQGEIAVRQPVLRQGQAGRPDTRAETGGLAEGGHRGKGAACR